MKHFDITQWTDFARGLVDASSQGAMREHLSSGCQECGSTVGLLQKVVASAAAEAAYEVPDCAVRMAKALYALQRPEEVALSRIVARLIFDSFRDPMPAGVRTQHGLYRQALYEAEDFCVDVRLDKERGTSCVTLVGQIISRREPNRRMAQMPIALLSGKTVVAHALSNSFGEFQMQYVPKRHVRLFVVVPDSGGIEVPLAEITEHHRGSSDKERLPRV